MVRLQSKVCRVGIPGVFLFHSQVYFSMPKGKKIQNSIVQPHSLLLSHKDSRTSLVKITADFLTSSPTRDSSVHIPPELSGAHGSAVHCADTLNLPGFHQATCSESPLTSITVLSQILLLLSQVSFLKVLPLILLFSLALQQSGPTSMVITIASI